jgi:glutamate/tyrosine decarboxylase-like PLP-dependent enzyme
VDSTHGAALAVTDALGMPADHMRRVGHRIVDLVVDHIESLPHQPALAVRPPAAMLALLGAGEPPESAGDIDELISVLVSDVFTTMQHGDHPRYFARVPGPSSFAGVAGDWLTAGFQAMAASWGGGSGPTAVELVVVDWFRRMMGLPEGTEGLLLSGGSTANLVALAAARADIGAGVVYYGDQTHSCVPKALHVLGVPVEERRCLPSGPSMRLEVGQVAVAIADDRRAGRRPGVLVATAGSTNTGAVDDLPQMAALARAEGIWLHVDAAYGGPARLVDPDGVLAATAAADSLVIDPHKWLFQPYDVAALLVSRPGVLERFYTMNPEYLADVSARHREEVDLRNRGIELTRRARAIKVWLTLRAHGLKEVRNAVASGIEMAEHAERVLRADPRWQVISPAQLGIVTFARGGVDDEGHQAAARDITESGYAAVTCTELLGRSVLRLCVLNPRTTRADVEGTIGRLAALCDGLVTGSGGGRRGS